MKIGKQLPTVTSVSAQDQRRASQAQQTSQRPAQQPAPRRTNDAERVSERSLGRRNSFTIQLNQQLSSLQSAERYLGDLENRLSAAKLSLSRELSNAARSGDQEGLRKLLRRIDELLAQRGERSGNVLDAAFKLRLNEPVRSRFSLEGLESIDAIRRSGRETLVFTGGSEPVAVVLEDGVSEQQILRAFNAGLGRLGIRAELDEHGNLKFSAREGEWAALRGKLAVQGEGKLAAKGRPTRLTSREDRLLSLPEDPALDSREHLRALLDAVVEALDKIAALREQIAHRREELRRFLASQSGLDEQEWALGFASQVFAVMNRRPSSYAAVTQAVLAQANISRYAVVSLLS